MGRQVPFTEYEAVLLLDAYLMTVNENVSRRLAVKQCSEGLRRMAVNAETEIDEAYRNINGIMFQMASMESAYRDETILKPATKLFTETVKIYRNDRERYEQILKEAKKMAAIRREDEILAGRQPEKERSFEAAVITGKQWGTESHMKISDYGNEEIAVSSTKKINFNNIVDMSFTRPVSVTYGGRTIEEDTWRSLYVDVCHHILNDYPDEFKRMLKESITGKTKTWLVDEKHKDMLTAPKEISPGHYVETNRNAINLVRNVKWILDQCGVGYEDVEITYESQDLSSKALKLQQHPIRSVKNKYNRYSEEEQSFYQWMMDTQGIAEITCRGYVASVRGAEKYAAEHGIEKTHLFGVDLYTAKAAADEMFSNADFVAYNEVQHRRYKDSITKLLMFLEDDSWKATYATRPNEAYLRRSGSSGSQISEQPQQNMRSSRKRGSYSEEEETFYQWMLSTKSVAEPTCRYYATSVRGAEEYAAKHGMENIRFYGVDLDTARAAADKMFSDADFAKFNVEKHNRYRAAITKLLMFLGDEGWSAPSSVRSGQTRVIHSAEELKLYADVLTEHFPKGYRLGSSLEMKKFRRYFEDINGTVLYEDQDALEGLIRECGVIHDGRVYMPGHMLSEDLRGRLFEYIDKSFSEGKTVIYFEALFHEFSEEFLDHNMYDADMLKTYISYVSEGKYHITKSYLSNEITAEADPIDDVRTFLKDRGLSVGTDEICTAMSHIPESKIRTILGSNGEFVRNSKGEYFHVDVFSLSQEELENIADLISAEIEAHKFVSGSELYDAIRKKYPYTYEKNATFSVLGWRDALKYKLGGRFSFVGNVISGKGEELSMSGVFENFAKERRSFTMSELLSFADNIGTTIYFDALYQDAVRVSRIQTYFRVRYSYKKLILV